MRITRQVLARFAVLPTLVLAAGCTGHGRAHVGAIAAHPATAQVVAAAPASGGTVRTTFKALHSKADAVATGDALLALVRPPGATRVNGVDTQLLGGPPGGMTDDPQQIDLDRLWTVAGTGTGYLAQLQAHPPAGFSVPAGSPGSVDATVFYEPLMPDPGAPAGSVTISAATDGDHAELRVDVEESWNAPRVPATILSASIPSAILDYVGPTAGFERMQDPDTTPKPPYAHKVVTGARFEAIASDLNALLPETLATHNCVAGDNETANVTVDSSGHHLVFYAQLNGCQDVSVSLDGMASQLLSGTSDLTRDVYHAIGVVETPIPRVPPQGPPVRTPVPPITVLEHDAVQAQRIGDHRRGLSGPQDAASATGSSSSLRPPYTGLGTAVDRGETFTVTGTLDQLVAWFRANPAAGTIAAEPLPARDGVRRLVMEPKDRSKPLQVLYWVGMVQHKDHVVFRIDAQTAWKR